MHSAKAISDLIEQALKEAGQNQRFEEAWDKKLASWEQPASDSEEATIERAAKMVREALSTNAWLQAEGVSIEPQGSYYNNTNVRQQADMDIRVVHPIIDVLYASEITALGRLGAGYNHTGHTTSQIVGEMRIQIEATLKTKFGANNVDPGNKAFRISSVPGSRSDIDVVPAMTFDYVFQRGFRLARIRGISILGRDGSDTLNFPEQHHQNGILKRERTAHRFKKVVRTLKSLRDDLAGHNVLQPDQVSSFMIECLVYCVEDEYFLVEENRLARLRRVLNRADELLSDPVWTSNALEINGVQLLFPLNQGWSVTKAQYFVRLALAYLEQ